MTASTCCCRTFTTSFRTAGRPACFSASCASCSPPSSPGRPAALPPPSLQYADFALWQREQLRGDKLERQLGYWRDRLAGAAPTLGLPADRPRPVKTGDRNGALPLSLDEALTRDLRQLATRHGASLFMVLLAGFELLLHRLAGQEDILVGSPIAGRQRRETEDLVGFFLNTLVLRTAVTPRPAFRELLLAVRETVLGATAHQDLPFEKLLIELQPERQLGQTPFFQVFFNMANIPDLRFELPGLEVEMLPIPEVGSKFDLNLYVFDNGHGGLELNLVYNPDLFDRARVRGNARPAARHPGPGDRRSGTPGGRFRPGQPRPPAPACPTRGRPCRTPGRAACPSFSPPAPRRPGGGRGRR